MLGTTSPARSFPQVADLFIRAQSALAPRYELIRELGRGGMATVFLADEPKHVRTVAIKVLMPEIAAAVGGERFLREIHTVARLTHPHILPLYDSGEAAGLLYYVMPYIDGESLRARLDRDKRLPVDVAIRIAREVGSALDYAHRHGVVHRDIKPENILLSGDHAVVTDFGIARALDSAGEKNLTHTGFIVGTPSYMSPEQASGRGTVDGRSDIYSLACTLYEMLSGERPFDGPTAQAILVAHLADTPRPLHEICPGVPESVEVAVERALSKAPAERYTSTGEFMAALSTGSEEATLLLSGSRRRRTFRRFTSRDRTVALVVAILVVAGTALAVFLLRRPALDSNLIAVAPFEVVEPQLVIWREGLADILSANLDGAGPLHAVSPAVVMKLGGNRVDRSTAGRLGTRTGARLIVFGRIVSAGRDSVRLTASVFDAGRGSTLAEVDSRGPVSDMNRVADSLTVGLIRELSRVRAIAGFRLASLTGRSLPAVKAFLVGEQFYRRAQWDSAASAFDRAITLDSDFALAIRHAANANAWRGNEALARIYAVRAAAHNHGLGQRDSLLVVADSIRVAVHHVGSANRALVARLFSTIDLAVRRYPADPEVWYELGEARYHVGDQTGATLAQTLDAFDRAIALDSTFVPAYLHALPLALRVKGASAADRYFHAYLAAHPVERFADNRELWLIHALLDPGRTSAKQLQRAIDTLPPATLYEAVTDLAVWTDSGETAVRLARMVAPRAALSAEDAGEGRALLQSTVALRGHLHEAWTIFPGDAPDRDILAEAAWLGTESPDTIAAVFARALKEMDLDGALMAVPWWAAHRDIASLERYLYLAERRLRSVADARERGRHASAVEAARGYLALARGDSTEALRRLPPGAGFRGPGSLYERLARARLHAAHHRDREALAALGDPGPCVLERAEPCLAPAQLLWSLERAMVTARLGDGDHATTALRAVTDAWWRADPPLQTALAAARAAVRGARR